MSEPETIFDRELRPIVEREVFSAPASRFELRPSIATDPRQLAAEVRARIDPAFARIPRTESHERLLCVEAIELLLAQRDDYRARLDKLKEKP